MISVKNYVLPLSKLADAVLKKLEPNASVQDNRIIDLAVFEITASLFFH